MPARHRLLALLAAAALAACGGREAGEPRPQGDTARSAAATVTSEARDGETPSRAAAAPDATTNRAESRAAAPAGTATETEPRGAALDRSAGPAEPQGEAAAILRRAAAAWKGVRTLQAGFTQRLSVPLMGTEQTSRGRIYHRRPDHFLMRFSDPAGDLLVADGSHVWMYYPSVDRTQVLRTSLANTGGQIDLQQEFLDNPTARYVPTLLGQKSVGGRPAHLLSLVPKGASPYKLVKVWVDQQDGLVRRFEMTEENGSVRRLELSGVQTGTELPDSLFAFDPPPGTQVFEQ